MRLEFLQITLEPEPGWGGYRRLEIVAKVNKKRFGYTRVIPPDDFQSEFDRIFDLACDEFKQGLRGRLDESRPGSPPIP